MVSDIINKVRFVTPVQTRWFRYKRDELGVILRNTSQKATELYTVDIWQSDVEFSARKF